jgi:hypothetical protein
MGGKEEGILSIKSRYQQTEHQCLKPVIPTTQEAEIGRILVQSQPGQNVFKTPTSKEKTVWWCTQ